MKRLIAILFVIAIVLLPLYPQKGFALSCVEPDLPHIEYDKHDAVIIGTIIDIENQSETNTRILTVKVDKSYKEIETKVVTIHEMLMWSESSIDQKMLFFLVKVEDKWVNSLCGPTTSNIALADQYLSDKPDLTLREDEVIDEIIENKIAHSLILEDKIVELGQQLPEKSLSPKSITTISAIVIALFIIAVTAILVVKRKYRQ